ncbi:MAG: riboflavin synthase, partial [bacterium]|nr:riboflavin synthase [bacterium]
GHYVTGHVDTVGRIQTIKKIGESVEIVITYESEFDSLVVEKGSIAINGVSLTVNHVTTGQLSVNVIPHTLSATNMNDWLRGYNVNLEFDLIGKYVIRQSSWNRSQSITAKKLRESGW